MPKVKMVKKDADAEPVKEKAKVVSMKTKKEAAPEEKPAKAEKGPSRYKGLTTGLRVMEFQDKTLKDNFKAKLTDEQLAELWRSEFPRAKAFDAKIVRVVRKLYNAGKHGKTYPAPEKPLFEYDELGNKVAPPKRGRPAAEPEAEVEVAPVKKSKKQ